MKVYEGVELTEAYEDVGAGSRGIVVELYADGCAEVEFIEG